MKNIIFIAPPASGKGTQSELLVNKYGYVHISTGDLLREEVKKESLLGKSIKKLMDAGELISDDIVLKLLKSKIESCGVSKNFIFDGYPRTINQAESLKSLALELNFKLDCVIYLNVDEITALKRAVGRLSCPKCGSIYNKYDELLSPINDNLCDKCNIPLTSRSDDNEVTFKERFQTYLYNTKPLLDYYEKLGIINVIASLTPEETFKEIEGVIND